MKNGLFKLCSMILVLVLLINMLPLQVMAEQLNTDRVEQNQLDSIPIENDVSAEQIVEEIPQKRTEFSKEFLLEDGLHMINVYPEAVHYETQNGWEEIDNTLITKADGTITNTAGVWDVSFPQQLSKDKSISVQKDGYTLSFYMAGEITSGNALMRSLGLARADDTESVTIANTQKSTAVIQSSDLSYEQTSAIHEQKLPQKTQSRLTYANVYRNTDVVYDLQSNKVKESIVLESYDSALQGYRYTLDVGTMIPVLEEDGQIIFYDANRENIVFVMPAPYMVDDAGEHNNDIQVTLSGSGSQYTMTYLVPRQWLAAEDRAWPVILDPVVQPALTTTNIRDRSVSEYATWSQTWWYNSCGYFNPEGKVRFFLKYDNLPQLTSSDVIINATIHMYKVDGTDNTMPVYVHKVLGTWTSEGITWANKPGYDATIEDYAVVQANDWYVWDITDIARGWYAEGNTGMMFKGPDDVENAGVGNYKQFLSSDYDSNKPVLSITFRNNNGLESYWDYTSTSAGNAGTGYINNYTGNLTWMRDDLGYDGNRMPVSIKHIYNANDAYVVSDNNNSNTSAGNSFGLGNGWRTNYNQLVYQWSLNGNYLVWEDADGTDHYFLQSSDGVYKDEDGLELKLEITAVGTEWFKLTDKNGNASYFDGYGRLFKIENNQQTKSSINITHSGSSRRISTITDGAGRKYIFSYNESDQLYKISYVGNGTEELGCMYYVYTDNNLTRVANSNYEYCIYTYGEDNLLTSAQDLTGYKLNYGYNTILYDYDTTEHKLPARAIYVEESYNGKYAGRLDFDYAHNQTTVTDYHGNALIYQFNNLGNTISVQDEEGHAQYYKYATDMSQGSAVKNNQLKVTSKMQNTVGNVLLNPCFESRVLWSPAETGGSVALSSSEVYIGGQSMQVITTIPGSGAHALNYYVKAGDTVTFSAYLKTGSASGCISIFDQNTQWTSEILEPYSNWTRLEVSYTNTSLQTKTICPYVLTPSVGTLWIDCVQLEASFSASRLNLIYDGDFYHSADLWSYDIELATVETAAPQLEDTVLLIRGNPAAQKRASQTISISGSAGDSFVFSGWAKGNSAPLRQDGARKREFAIHLQFYYADGVTSEPVVAQFNPDSNEWQYSAAAAVAERAYSFVIVSLVYNYNVNTVYFDGIQLFKEEFGNSFTYDNEGNVTSAKDLQKQNTSYEYVNNNLTKVIENNNTKMTYTYDAWHNVKTATGEDGVTYNFEYDTYGNNTSVSATVGGVTLSTSATYSADGNQLVSTTDALGKQTTYGYNLNTGLLDWVQNPEDTQATRTNYTYDNLSRRRFTYSTTDTGNDMSVYYNYSVAQLSKIETETTPYFFTYGDFGLVTSVSAGNYPLVTYTYTNDRRNNISRLDFGVSDYVEYTYDTQSRLLKETFRDGNTVSYDYDNNGEVAVVTDSFSGITTRYYYDLIGRAAKQTKTGTNHSHSVQYAYDSNNNLDSLKETINGVSHTNDYAYDSVNRVSSVTNSTAGTTGTTGEHYTYDSFSRVQQSVTKNGNTNVLTESYTFTAPSANATSGQIATNRLQAAGYDVTYSYTYDDNGNILSVSDGTNTTSYAYDSANQLIRENNQAGGFTHTWEYDNGGNILSCKEYAYTTGELGTPINTIPYTYCEETWGDLFASRGNQTSGFDDMGNSLYDGTWLYTWSRNKLLTSMYDGNAIWYLTYDADGMRTHRYNDVTQATYHYFYNGGSLSQMTVNGNTLYFAYGANGTPMSVTYNGTVYYYVTNIQGDVIAILDGAGNPVVTYSYDAWGNHLSVTGTMASTLGTLNPLRYRGYVFDNEIGIYYLQSRYYNPKWGRFISADSYISTGQGILGHNMFVYCNNNPVNLQDPTGEIAITTLILIGSVVIGAVAAGYTAYKEHQAGFNTTQIVGDSLCAGFSAFSIVYTGGMSLYHCYQNYCYLNAITPVTDIGTTPPPAQQLQNCADSANSAIPGNGPTVGTKKHSVFAQNVNNLGRNDLATEVSYKNGTPVPYGTPDSVRFDVVQYNKRSIPIAAWDLKTGSAMLTQSRIAEMQRKSGLSIPIFPLR